MDLLISAQFHDRDVGGDGDGVSEDLAMTGLLRGGGLEADALPPLLLFAGADDAGGGGNSEGSEYHGSIPDTCRSRALCHML
jgi:hypothetical protein